MVNPVGYIDGVNLSQFHLSVEFREEFLFEEETDLVAGAALGLSYFL